MDFMPEARSRWVAQKPRREWRTRPMRIPRIQAALAARIRASSTPARCVSQIEIELPCASCHRKHCDMQL